MEDNITFITGDLFDTKANVILHQVNCQGVMGSGLRLKLNAASRKPMKIIKLCALQVLKNFF